MSLHKKNNAVHRGFYIKARCRVREFALGDKEIAVKIRGNSHYRNSCNCKSSRNAYRSVTRKGLLGKLGG